MGRHRKFTMKELTSSIYSFEDIIQGGFLYVDKTEYVWQLIRPAKELYFLSRPRRFGKSLLISTLKALFQGRRELFKGLALYDKPYDWREYPVIHLDFANSVLRNERDVTDFLRDELDELSRRFGIPLRGRSLIKQFEFLIRDLAESSPAGNVVVLIDEYDKPILDNITNLQHCQKILRVLKGFYSNVKKCEAQIRLAFITGVSKFSRVSLFSDLNNLTDITLDPGFAGMLGFTEAEIRDYYAELIPDAAKANGCSEPELLSQLFSWYDGYRFSEAGIHVCNPVSITKFFRQGYRFSNYWDSTGTPSFLLEMMKTHAYDHEAALTQWYDESVFSAYEPEHLDITGLLWQTGYLTIREVRKGFTGAQYRLDLPDQEVKQTFMNRLLESYAGLERGMPGSLIERFCKAIYNDDLERFMTLFQSFLANINYRLHIPQEKYYQTIFFIVFKLLGIFIEAESHTNQGRIDAYIRTAKAIYIFEFKLDKSADAAVSQMEDRRYHEKFRGHGLPIRLIGVNFDSGKGRIEEWKERKA